MKTGATNATIQDNDEYKQLLAGHTLIWNLVRDFSQLTAVGNPAGATHDGWTALTEIL